MYLVTPAAAQVTPAMGELQGSCQVSQGGNSLLQAPSTAWTGMAVGREGLLRLTGRRGSCSSSIEWFQAAGLRSDEAGMCSWGACLTCC